MCSRNEYIRTDVFFILWVWFLEVKDLEMLHKTTADIFYYYHCRYLSTAVCLYLSVDVEQHHVVSTWNHKVHSGVVSVHHLVFGPVEDGVVHRKHGSYRQNLFWTLVPEERENQIQVEKVLECIIYPSSCYSKVWFWHYSISIIFYKSFFRAF